MHRRRNKMDVLCFFLVEVKCNECVLCVLMPVVMIITYSPVAFFHFQIKRTPFILKTAALSHQQSFDGSVFVGETQSFAFWKFHNEFNSIRIFRMKMIMPHIWRDLMCECVNVWMVAYGTWKDWDMQRVGRKAPYSVRTSVRITQKPKIIANLFELHIDWFDFTHQPSN